MITNELAKFERDSCDAKSRFFAAPDTLSVLADMTAFGEPPGPFGGAQNSGRLALHLVMTVPWLRQIGRLVAFELDLIGGTGCYRFLIANARWYEIIASGQGCRVFVRLRGDGVSSSAAI